MYRVFTQILPCGILPALSQHISYTSKLGIFENPNCLRCLKGDPELLLSPYNYRALITILSMCTAQDFFQTFCTRAIEYTLLAMVGNMSIEYVFVLDFWR